MFSPYQRFRSTTTIVSFFFGGIIGVASGEGLEKVKKSCAFGEEGLGKVKSCVDIIKKKKISDNYF
jgi:hypothetical protein